MLCPRCGCIAKPKLVTKEDKKHKKWIITQCPREDCAFNYDLRRYSAVDIPNWEREPKAIDYESYIDENRQE